jgi:hypothetical protein
LVSQTLNSPARCSGRMMMSRAPVHEIRLGLIKA